MKKSLLNIAGAALLAFAVINVANANPINGAITFSGGVTLDTGNVNTATAVTAWSAPIVSSTSGDFSSVSNGTGVAFVAPWSFNTSTTIVDFWKVGGFEFDLLSSSIIAQVGNGSLYVTGTGTAYGNGFTPFAGSWSFTTQNPSAGGTFSFSAGTAVPDGGTTALLVGLSLLGVSVVARRRKSA